MHNHLGGFLVSSKFTFTSHPALGAITSTKILPCERGAVTRPSENAMLALRQDVAYLSKVTTTSGTE